MSILKQDTKIHDRYVLKELKGRGSFGEVWRAYDEELRIEIALKIYVSLDSHGIEEFKDEYLITRDIHHPHLLTATYFAVWEHHPYLIMDYCGQGSVGTKAGAMEEREIWRFLRDVSAGLAHLHTLNPPIIHQDIKPDNILQDDSGAYKITDFGISKKLRATMRKQSLQNTGMGATAYMGPERFDGNSTLVIASDIWALGASIYELATGELPFAGLGGHMQRAGADLPILDKKWSRDLNMVMQSCLAKDPAQRPTAKQLADYAEARLQGQTPVAAWKAPAQAAKSALLMQGAILRGKAFVEGSKTLLQKSLEGVRFGARKGVEGLRKGGHVLAKVDRKIWLGAASIGVLIALGAVFVPWGAKDDAEPMLAENVGKTGSDRSLGNDGNDGHLTGSAVEASQGAPLEEPSTVNTASSNDDKASATQAPERPDSKASDRQKEEVNKAAEEGAGQAPLTRKPEEAPIAGNKEAAFKRAKANGDYATIRSLADQGYAPACGSYATYCFNKERYNEAASYSQKAANAGNSEGERVLEKLRQLGW